MAATNRLLVVTSLTLALVSCGGSVESAATAPRGEAGAAPLQDAATGDAVIQGASSSGNGAGSGSSSGAGAGGSSSSGGPNESPDAAGDAVSEVTVVEVDGATVTGMPFGNPEKFQTCIAGNGVIQAGYLYAAPVNLPSTGTVQGLGLITDQSAVATMGLYASAPAGTFGLVTQTASTSVTAGSNVIPTQATALPGTGMKYWVAAEFEQTTSVCADGWGAQVQFGMEPYGTFPSIWSPTAATTNSQLNLFVVVN